MNTHLYVELRAKAATWAAGEGLDERFALGALNAMWPTIEAATSRGYLTQGYDRLEALHGRPEPTLIEHDPMTCTECVKA